MGTYRHLDGDLIGTKGTWRAELKPTAFDAEGDPSAWRQLAMVSCSGCGLQFTIGSKGRPGIVDGKSAGADCPHCKRVEDIELDGWSEQFKVKTARGRKEVDDEKLARKVEALKKAHAAKAAASLDAEIAELVKQHGGRV
jgi:hypothetical protein